jgi:hypothetical protein
MNDAELREVIGAMPSLIERAIAVVGSDAFDRSAQEEFGRLSIEGDDAILSWPRADDAMGHWLHVSRQEARFSARLLIAVDS